jgi:hypothetical protein
MKSKKLIAVMAWGVCGIAVALTAGTLFVSCGAKAVPTAPPPPTNTPVFTNSPTVTRTPTASPTTTPTPNATQTVAATESMIPTGTPSSTPTNTATATVTATPASGLGPGSVEITGLLYNGQTQFSFVSTTDISAGVSIYFTTYSYDNTTSGLVDESTTSSSTSNWPTASGTSESWEGSLATTITEGTIAYVTGGSGLTSYSQVIMGNPSDGSVSLQGGTAYSIVGNASTNYLVLNHNGAGNKILAYTVGSGPTTTYLGAVIFGPDSWYQNVNTGAIPAGNFWDSYLPPGLNSTTSLDLSGLWSTDALNADNTATLQNDNAVLDQCGSTLAAIVNPANWAADGNQSKKAVCLSVPLCASCVTPLTPCSNAGFTGTMP